MADSGAVLGGIRVDIRGDWSGLASDLSAAEAAAARAAGTISGSFNAAIRPASQLVDQYGRAIQSAAAATNAASAPTDKLASSVSNLSRNIAAATSTTLILTDALQNNAQASAVAAVGATQSAAAIGQIGNQLKGALDALKQQGAAAASLKEGYLSLGLAVRTIRIAEMIARGTEAVYEFFAKIRDSKDNAVSAFQEIALAIQTTGDDLTLAKVKVDNLLAKLSGRPENAVSQSLAEGAIQADKYAKSLDEVLKRQVQASNQQQVTRLTSALSGQLATTPAKEILAGTSGTGAFVAQATKIAKDYAVQIAQATSATDQLALAQKRDAAIADAAAGPLQKLNELLADQQRFADLSKNRPGLAGPAVAQTRSDIATLQALITQAEVQTPTEARGRTAAQTELERQNAQRAAIIPASGNERALAAIREQIELQTKAGEDAIEIERAKRDAAIAAITDPHERAVAAANSELKAAQDKLALIKQIGAESLKQETPKIAEQGRLRAQGKEPEQATAATINAQREQQSLVAALKLKTEEAESAVTRATENTNKVIAEQARETAETIAASQARTQAIIEGAAAERTILEQERAIALASRATGDAKISMLREQAAAQSAIRNAEVVSLLERGSATVLTGDQVKGEAAIAEAIAKGAENRNKDYAAQTKINQAVMEERLQLAEIASQRSESLEKAGFEGQKQQVTAQYESVPLHSAQQRIAYEQQILAIQEQENARAVQLAEGLAIIKALMGDLVGSEKAYAQAAELAAKAANEDAAAKARIANQQAYAPGGGGQTSALQAYGNQVTADIQSVTNQIIPSIGNAIGQALTGPKQKGESEGTAIERALKNVGMHLLGDLIGKLITTTISNALSQIAAGWAQTWFLAATPRPLGFAGGGSPPLNVPSIVGERGPEIFVPRQAGTIIPNEYAMSSGLMAALGGLGNGNAGANPALFVPDSAISRAAGLSGTGMPGFASIGGSSSSSSVSFQISQMHVHGVATPKDFVRQLMHEMPNLLKTQGGPAFSPHSRAFQGASQ